MTTISTKKMTNRLADLLAEGRPVVSISKTLSKEFDEEISPGVVNRMIKRQTILKKQIIKTDDEFKEVYKETLFKIVRKADSNLDLIEHMRDLLVNKLDELKDDVPESKLIKFTREINMTAKTLNDCIKSLNELLKRMETETQEVQIDHMQSVQDTIKTLKNLEECGYIEIKPDLYKTPMYGEVMKKDEI